MKKIILGLVLAGMVMAGGVWGDGADLKSALVRAVRNNDKVLTINILVKVKDRPDYSEFVKLVFLEACYRGLDDLAMMTYEMGVSKEDKQQGLWHAVRNGHIVVAAKLMEKEVSIPEKEKSMVQVGTRRWYNQCLWEGKKVVCGDEEYGIFSFYRQNIQFEIDIVLGDYDAPDGISEVDVKLQENYPTPPTCEQVAFVFNYLLDIKKQNDIVLLKKAIIENDEKKVKETLFFTQADPTIKDETGKSAFDYAKEAGNPEIIQLFKDVVNMKPPKINHLNVGPCRPHMPKIG